MSMRLRNAPYSAIPGDPFDAGERRRVLLQQHQEPAHGGRAALDLGEDPAGVVADQAEAGGQGVDEWPEAHPLDDPLDSGCRPDPLGHRSSLSPILAGRRAAGRL